MIREIDENREALAALCQRFRVQRLELFGSAAQDRHVAGESDLDFLVEFFPLPAGERADAYFGLLAALQGLFKQPVDLVMVRAIRNPYFLQGIAPSRTTLYAA